MLKILVPSILAFFVSFSVIANEAPRLIVEEEIIIDAPADKVWKLVSDFGGLHQWHPAIKNSVMDGDKTRILNLGNDITITEELKVKDDTNKRLKYEIVDMSVVETVEFADEKVERSALPVKDYTGVLRVKSDGDKSKVTWKGIFYLPWEFELPAPTVLSDDDAKTAMSGVYKAGLENLKKLMESKGG